MPLRQAYDFAADNSLAAEAKSIKGNRPKWPGDSLALSSTRRGQIVHLFTQHGIFDKFVKERWNNGETPKGRAEIRAVLAKYHGYIAYKKNR
jgi:hypothetical protein